MMQQVPIQVGQNYLAGMAGGVQAGQQMRQANDQNTLRNIFDTQDINDPAVQKRIMGLDPQMGMQLQDRAYQREQDVYQRGRQEKADNRADQTFEMKIKEHALTLSAAERAQKAAEVRQAVTPAVVAHRQGPDAFRAYVTQNAPEIAQTLQAVGIDPTQLTYENALQALAKIEGIADVFEMADSMVPEAPEDPAEIRALRIRAQEAGLRAGTPEYQTFMASGGKEQDAGMMVALPDGTMVATGGAALSGGVKSASVGDVYNPGEVQGTLDLIDEIVKDPALSRVTGPLEGGGGNDVGSMNIMQRAYYGNSGLSVIQKINQLQSRSWLAARDMLKGGGPITDYESRKAEAAVARLERPQGDDEFLIALNDLRDAIKAGMEKLKGQDLPADKNTDPEITFQNDEQRAVFELYSR